MYSFAWPNMFNSSSSLLLSDKDAIRNNIRLLLSSERLSLFGDPYFGTQLKQAIFEQSGQLIVDLLIDEIYTTLITFIPQIHVNREDIEIVTDGIDIKADILLYYKLDNTADLYNINLTNSGMEG